MDDATYGTLVASQEFDPWGNRRKAEDWTQVLPTLNIQSWFRDAGPITGRGYTGHESMDEMGLVHMNGRVYDPKLGRMIQADPLIQAPYFSQSLNRYSYVWNNPMRFTDSSGYCATEPPEQSPPKEEEPEKEQPQDSGFMEEQIVYGTRPPEFDYSYLFWTDSDDSGSTGGGGKPSDVNGKPSGSTDTSCGRMCPKQVPNQKTNHKEQLQNIADVLNGISAVLTLAGMIAPVLLAPATVFGLGGAAADALAGDWGSSKELAASQSTEMVVKFGLNRIPGFRLLPDNMQENMAGQIVAGPETVYNAIDAAKEADKDRKNE